MAQFSQPSNGPPIFTRQDVQRLIQRLDAANRRIDEYAHLTASLTVELKQYRDIMCMSCKERVLDANLHTTTLQQPGVNSPTPFSRDDATFLRKLFEPTGSEPSSPLALSLSDYESFSSVETHSDSSFHTASQSMPNPSNTTSDLPPFPTLMAPVEYNPEIKKSLDLSVVSILAVPAGVGSITFSRDGRYFAVALTNEETHIYDMATMSKNVLVDHGTSVIYSEAAAAAAAASIEGLWTVQFSPDTKSIATGGADGQIKIWDIKRKRVRTIFKEHTDVTCIDFSPDGRFIASASYDGTVRMWCTRDGSSKYLSRPIGSAFRSVASSPDGRYVAAGNDDRYLRIWDARTCHLSKTKKWGDSGARSIWSVTFRPDGKRLASAGGSEYAWRSWNVSSLQGQLLPSERTVNDEVEQEVFPCKGHTGAIYSISFSPDGRWVLTSSIDHTSRVWEATTGAWVCTLTGHTGSVESSDFSPIGHHLMTGGQDGRVILWKYREVEE